MERVARALLGRQTIHLEPGSWKEAIILFSELLVSSLSHAPEEAPLPIMQSNQRLQLRRLTSNCLRGKQGKRHKGRWARSKRACEYPQWQTRTGHDGYTQQALDDL
jgi:hypothetical protein